MANSKRWTWEWLCVPSILKQQHVRMGKDLLAQGDCPKNPAGSFLHVHPFTGLQDRGLRLGLFTDTCGPGGGVLGDQVPGVVVNRQDFLGLNELDGAESVIGAHGEVVAD